MKYYFSMVITAIDSRNAGILNEKRVLLLLKQHGTLSQAQICKKTGLGSSTITYIVGRLRDKEMILEQPGQSSKRGAKPVLIELNPAGQYIIGTEINPSYLLIGLFDFRNNMVDKLKVLLEQGHTVETISDLLEVNIKGLLGKHTIAEEKLTGVGVTLSGSISTEGVIQMSSPMGWKNVPLKALLSQTFSCPVDIYTTKVRLLAEMSVQPSMHSKNIVYLNVANGVGTTVIVDDRLIHGSTNRCGELGHVVVDPNGPVCGCGQRGCLEAHISGPAIAKRIKDDLACGRQSVLSEYLTGQEVPEDIAEKWKQAIDDGDGYAIELRDFVADKLSRSAAIAINLYDPDLFILAGYINAVSSDYFIEQIKRRFKTDVYDQSSRNIEVITACAGQEALIRGVAMAVFQEQFKVE